MGWRVMVQVQKTPRRENGPQPVAMVARRCWSAFAEYAGAGGSAWATRLFDASGV